MRFSQILSPQSPARIAVDLLWIGAFAVAIILMSDRGLQIDDAGVALELTPGSQRKALYRGQRRFGTITDQVTRQDAGWKIVQRFSLAEAPTTLPRSDGGPRAMPALCPTCGALPSGLRQAIATVEVELRGDLSTTGLKLEADLNAVLGMLGGVAASKVSSLLKSSPVLRRFIGGKVELSGTCDPLVGSCRVRGTAGAEKVDRLIRVGRGPEVAAAIYPLLARGVIGQEAELTIFDPLQMRQRSVTYKVRAGTKRIRLHAGEYEAIEVDQDLDGLISKVWLDRGGRVLLEELPFGVRIEHESWRAADNEPPKEASKP